MSISTLLTAAKANFSAATLRAVVDADLDDPEVEGPLGKDLLTACLTNLENKDAQIAELAAQIILALFTSHTNTVVEHINSIVGAMNSAPAGLRGYLAVITTRLAKSGHAKDLLTGGALKPLVAYLSDADSDVVTACLEALCEVSDADSGSAASVDGALAMKTFSELLGKSDPEIQNGALHLLASVARLDQTRQNILSDKALVQRLIEGLASDEISSGSVAALQVLTLTGGDFVAQCRAQILKLIEDGSGSYARQVSAVLLLGNLSKTSVSTNEEQVLKAFINPTFEPDLAEMELHPEDIAFAVSSSSEIINAVGLWIATHVGHAASTESNWKAYSPRLRTLAKTLATSSSPVYTNVAQAALLKFT